jgi:hypothetical protein
MAPTSRGGRFRSNSLGVAVLVLALGAVFALPSGVVGSGTSASVVAPARSVAAPALPTSGLSVGTTCYGTSFPSACTAAASALRPATTSPPVPPQTWSDLTPSAGTPPAARWLGSMVWDPVDGYVLLFGGYNETAPANLYSDSWAFVHGHWTELSASGPSGRYAAGLAWDAVDGYAVLFGGYNGLGVAYNDTWTYVHDTWTNITGTAGTAPAPRWRFGMTWDGGDGYVLLFGGSNAAETTFYNDTWEFLHGTWTELTPTGHPLLRYRFSLVYDPLDNYTIAFGGCTSSTCSSLDSSTWAYSNDSWTALAPTGHPGARIYYAVTYSEAAHTVQLFGGSTAVAPETPLADTWNFTGGNWTSITSMLANSPKALAYASMAYDPVDHYTVLFGGATPDGSAYYYTNATWVLGPSIIGQVTTSPPAIDLHQNVTVNATPQAYHSYASYQYTALPPGCSAGNVSAFTCVPNATGTFPIAVTVNDSLGVPQVENGSLSVQADPAILSFSSPHANVTVGNRTSFNVTVSGGTVPYTYRYTGLPSGCGTGNTANLSCVPDAPGPYTVQVEATDGAHYDVTASLSGTVNPAPNVTSMLAVPPTVDVHQNLTIHTVDVGGTGPLTYAYTGLPAGCLSTDVAVLTCQPSAPYAGLVSVNVTDAFGRYTTDSIPVTVNADPSIVTSAASPHAFDVGTVVRLWANATGGTGALAYAYSNLPAGCTPADSGVTSCTPLEAGNFTVTVRVTDSVGESANGSMSFEVHPALLFSMVTSTPGAVDLGQSVSIFANTTGGTAPFEFAYRGLPAGCTASPTAAWTNCTPTRAGTFTVTATVTDASGQSQPGSGTVVVRPDPSVNLTTSATSVTVGASVQILAVPANGTGGYSYVYTGLPTGCATANRSALSCTPSATGTFEIGVTIRDGVGYSASAHTNLTVSPKTSSSVLGLSAPVGYGLIAVLVLIVLAAIAFVMLRRRGPPKQPAAAGEAWTESDSAPVSEEWQEPGPPSG